MTGRAPHTPDKRKKGRTAKRGKEEEESENEGEFECARQADADRSHRQLMVLEHRQGRGGTGGELETHREEERRRDEKVESWSAIVPQDQTMMGLYYPAMLPVSSLL